MAGQIIRRGDRRWLVRWYIGRVNGKRHYASKLIHGTKKQATRALREVLARQDLGHAVPLFLVVFFAHDMTPKDSIGVPCLREGRRAIHRQVAPASWRCSRDSRH